METYLYRMNFKSPVHFGAYGIGLEETSLTLSSDALTSAIINAFALLEKGDDVASALKRKNDPAFVLSSLFPFGPGPGEPPQACSYALPKPMYGPFAEDPTCISKYGKTLKSLKYLTPEDFALWTGPDKFSAKNLADIIERCEKLAQNGSQDEGAWWTEEMRTRVALDRDTSRSAVWRCGLVHFQNNAGLYGLVNIIEESWKEPLSKAFTLLGEMGLGGERTYGMGLFEFSGFEPAPAIFTVPNSGNWVLLSSYHPAEGERQSLPSRLLAWDFRQNRGYITIGRNATTLKRRTVRFLSEGSVFREPVIGSLADVTPDAAVSWGNIKHRIIRSGLAFFLPMQGGGPCQKN